MATFTENGKIKMTSKKTKKQDNNFEELGVLIDSIDNLYHALKIPMPAQFHIDQLNISLPEKIKEFRNVYVKITGENPWEFHD